MTRRLEIIRRRLLQLDAEHRGRDLPADVRAEVERLEREAEGLHVGGGELQTDCKRTPSNRPDLAGRANMSEAAESAC